MDRRTFICTAAQGLLAVPFAAPAQNSGKVHRIGVLGAGSAAQSARRMEVFRQALQVLGRVNQRNVTFEERWADGRFERLPGLAAELLAQGVDLILAVGGTPAVEAATKATREVPIVFTSIGDPVAQKIVQSLARPGGNVTGFALMDAEMFTKRLALLIEAVPGIKQVALLVNGANPYAAEALPRSQNTSRAMGIQLKAFDVRAPEDFEKTFDSISHAGVRGAVVVGDDFLMRSLKQLAELALKHRLPLVAREPELGVLVAYDFYPADAGYRLAATYVDKIFKGAMAGDLPIEQPTKFSLVINLKTAKALGLTIPQSLLLRADEVIQW